MRALKLLTPVLGLLLLANSCKKEEPNTTTTASGSTPLYVRMTDAPGNYQEVNVDLKEVLVHSDKDGWISLTTKAGIYNLLDLTNGLDTLIGSATVPSGTVSQIRLVLGSNNSVKVNDTVYPLSTPSAEQSGLKLQVHETLVENVGYTILLDFDAGKSIIQTGKGTYKLKPVLRTITKSVNGAIQGSVTPAASHPAVYAILGTDTVSTSADSTGKFLIKGLAAGAYKLVFMPTAQYNDTTINNVNVTIGSVTQTGTITIK